MRVRNPRGKRGTQGGEPRIFSSELSDWKNRLESKMVSVIKKTLLFLITMWIVDLNALLQDTEAIVHVCLNQFAQD